MWKAIKDYPGYEVSDEGQVRSPRRLLKPLTNFYNGYNYINLGTAGGSAGACTSGKSNITWLATGQRYGALN